MEKLNLDYFWSNLNPIISVFLSSLFFNLS